MKQEMEKSVDDGPDGLSQTCNDNAQNGLSYQPQIETDHEDEKRSPKVTAEIDEIDEIQEELKEL